MPRFIRKDVQEIKNIGLVEQIEARTEGWFIRFDSGDEYGPYKNALEMTKAWREAIYKHYHPNNAERRRMVAQ